MLLSTCAWLCLTIVLVVAGVFWGECLVKPDGSACLCKGQLLGDGQWSRSHPEIHGTAWGLVALVRSGWTAIRNRSGRVNRPSVKQPLIEELKRPSNQRIVFTDTYPLTCYTGGHSRTNTLYNCSVNEYWILNGSQKWAFSKCMRYMLTIDETCALF